jgi:uncharacterized protein (TIGR02118 family)
VAEVKLMVLYPTPTDVEEFESAYTQEHAPMVNEKVPKVTRWTASRVLDTPTGDAPPYHLVAELYFASVDDLQEALGTEGGQETAAHAVSISTGGPPVLLVSEEEAQ